MQSFVSSMQHFIHSKQSTLIGKTIRRSYRRGMTMIEIAIAVGLATILVIMLYGTFWTQITQLRTQDIRSEMHQNGRFALEILTRSLRMAGFGSGAGFIYGVMGNGGAGNALPVIIPSDGGNSDSDVFTVAYMEPSLVMNSKYTVVESCSTTSITFDPLFMDYGDKLRQFRADDLLMCQDYATIGTPESYLWSISADAEATTPFGAISVTANSQSDYSSVCGSSDNLTPVLRCSKGQVITFYIDASDNGVGPGSAEHPVLMMDLNGNYPNNDDVPLVDNIEDLQLQYCVDDSTDTVNCNISNKWIDSFTASTQIKHVWGARVSLIVRSAKEDFNELYVGVRPRLANHNKANSTDKYFREIVSGEVAIRNLRLLSTN